MDTVADTTPVAPATRLEHLRALLEMIKYGPDPELLRPFQRDLASRQTHDGERALLKQLDRALAWLEAQPPEDRWELRRTLARIGRGQELDVLRFGEGTADAPKPLATGDGTRRIHVLRRRMRGRTLDAPLRAASSRRLAQEGRERNARARQAVRPGSADGQHPARSAGGFVVGPLLPARRPAGAARPDDPRPAPRTGPRAAVARRACAQQALEHLDAAWEYVKALGPYKLRYACALPVLIGLETLGLLAKTSPLEAGRTSEGVALVGAQPDGVGGGGHGVFAVAEPPARQTAQTGGGRGYSVMTRQPTQPGETNIFGLPNFAPYSAKSASVTDRAREQARRWKIIWSASSNSSTPRVTRASWTSRPSLGISQASVTNMVQRLDAEGLLKYEKYRGLALTTAGETLARNITRRHQLLTDFLKLLGLPDDVIFHDVEGMEHHISPPTLRAIET